MMGLEPQGKQSISAEKWTQPNPRHRADPPRATLAEHVFLGTANGCDPIGYGGPAEPVQMGARAKRRSDRSPSLCFSCREPPGDNIELALTRVI